MLNVHLTPDDIARVTVASTCGQLSEAIFSLDVLKRRRSSRHNAWARDLSPAARQAGSSLSCLASSPIPIDLITLISLSTSSGRKPACRGHSRRTGSRRARRDRRGQAEAYRRTPVLGR